MKPQETGLSVHQDRGGMLLILAAGHRRLQAAAAAANWSFMAQPVEVRRVRTRQLMHIQPPLLVKKHQENKM